MTNLTEQKGKKTHYYIKLPNSDVFIGDEFALSLYRNCKDGDKVEILGEVPSYEKYISLVNWKEDLTKLCTVKERIIEKYENIDTWWKANYTELKEENAQLKKWCEEFNALDVAKENIKLKELLMSARNYLKSYRDLYSKDNEDIVDFIKEIDQVLADNKIQANTVACNKIQEK